MLTAAIARALIFGCHQTIKSLKCYWPKCLMILICRWNLASSFLEARLIGGSQPSAPVVNTNVKPLELLHSLLPGTQPFPPESLLWKNTLLPALLAFFHSHLYLATTVSRGFVESLLPWLNRRLACPTSSIPTFKVWYKRNPHLLWTTRSWL